MDILLIADLWLNGSVWDNVAPREWGDHGEVPELAKSKKVSFADIARSANTRGS